MLNYSEEEKRIIRTYSSHKDLTITFLDDDNFAPIKGDRIYWESLKLTESLCDSENLIFGSCESSEMQIQVADVLFEIKNHEIRLDLTVDEIPVPLGIFFIANVERATDKRYKILTCYDRMYYMQMDVIEWYNSLFPTVDTAVTLKQLRDSFFAWMGIEQENTNLVNDNIIVRKTIDAEELSGIQVIEGICEINGAFGHINRYGVFEYKYLDNTAIYPSETLYPRNDLYPGGGESQEITNANYIPPSEYSDYMVRGINKLRVGEGENNIGATVTSKNYIEDEENSYIVNSNFLIYGNNAEELESIANNLGTKIFGITYTPNSTNLVAIPYIEVGDAFHVSSTKTPFVSFVLKRTLSGIQAMQDLWEAKGEEFQPDIATGSNRDIIQLRSRVNSLTRTVDETASEIKSVEAELSGDITTLDSKITQNASSITAEVARATTAEGNLSSKITQNASSITAEVARATTAEGNLSTRVQVTEKGLSSKVDKNGIISSINQTSENVTINASKINLEGLTTFLSEEERYVTEGDLGPDGTTTINGGRIDTQSLFSRDITATNFKITGGSINIQTNSDDTNIIILKGPNSTATYAPHLVQLVQGGNKATISPSGIGTTMGSQEATFSSGSARFSYNGDQKLRIMAREDGYGEYYAPTGHEFKGIVVLRDGGVLGDFSPIISDRKLKENGRKLDVDKTAEFIYSLVPREYTLKRDEEHRVHHGLYADEVHKALNGEERKLYTDNSENENLPEDFQHKTLCYDDLHADYIATLQSQNKRICELEEQVKVLGEQVKALLKDNMGTGINQKEEFDNG